MPETWDVVVIGAGPAGSRAARAAAAGGARVLLVERKRRAGALPHCAEFVPRALGLEMDLPPRSKVQPVEGMETRLGHAAQYTPSPGWILDRQVFDHGLALEAAQAGAVLQAATKFMGLEDGRLVIQQGGERSSIQAGCVVAADGAASATARAFGLPRQDLLAGVQVEVPLAAKLERSLIYLAPAYEGGYAWLFPKGAAANLGVGSVGAFKPRRLLEALRQRLVEEGLIKPGVLAWGGGAIPVGGPRKSPILDKLILTGDAAGLTHPITGAGIPQAITSGGLAGQAALALAGGKSEAAQEYAHELDIAYKGYLGRGLAARQRMLAGWGSQDFSALMAEAWPGWKLADGEKA
jgi:digeranylgeranylglycerophospholipid reductase